MTNHPTPIRTATPTSTAAQTPPAADGGADKRLEGPHGPAQDGSAPEPQERLPVPEAVELDTPQAWEDFQNSQLEFDRWYCGRYLTAGD